MAILCSMMGHTETATRHRNQGMEFSICHHCGCDLIREGEADWREVPKGFRVVWRGLGSAGDAASVASRMTHQPPPRRRDPRGARPAPRRDPRGRPLFGAASTIGMLANLGKLVGPDDDAEAQAGESNAHPVICLPGAAGK